MVTPSPLLTRCTPSPSGWVRSILIVAALAAVIALHL